MVIVAVAASPSDSTPESRISFFKTVVAVTPAGPPMSFTSTSKEVPFRTVITGPAGSAPNRAVAKTREETTNDKTFIVLSAFPPIYQLKIGSQLERRIRISHKGHEGQRRSPRSLRALTK